ncbi:MAG: LCP family protein [Eggerthellaceae bacterium]|nr:LCP family protein [Eggerthellaceae bacterium]
MSNNKDENVTESQDAPSSAPGGFVPATYQRNAKKDSQVVGTSTLDQYSRSSQHYKSSDNSMSRNKKIAVAVIIAVLVIAVGALGFYVFKEIQKQAINEDLRLSEEESLKVEKELTQKKKERERTTFDEPFTVLLLGSDARADDPDMGARTDTIILVRVDPTINRISMVSIPRDTRIEIEGQGFQKFNAAYTFGGPSGTISAVKQLTGVDIDHYAEINFEGLVGLVDAIGGIDVVVDEEIDDEDAGGHIDAGEQHLDGEHALILARSRAYVDGDYSRQANQRKVIMAIINKALTAPASELSGIIKASTKFLKTDKGIDVDFIYDLADQIRHNNDYPVEIFTASIPSSTATIDEVSWVIADTAGVKAMMKLFVEGKDVSQGVSESSIAEDIAAARGTSVDDENLFDEGAIGVSYYEGDDYAASPELYEEGYAEGDGVSEYGYEGEYEGNNEGEGEYVDETESGDNTEDEG